MFGRWDLNPQSGGDVTRFPHFFVQPLDDWQFYTCKTVFRALDALIVEHTIAYPTTGCISC